MSIMYACKFRILKRYCAGDTGLKPFMTYSHYFTLGPNEVENGPIGTKSCGFVLPYIYMIILYVNSWGLRFTVFSMGAENFKCHPV